MITIVIADDHLIVRQGLRALLDAETDFMVVGEAGNGQEALEILEKLQPDILVADLTMPILSGIEITQKSKQFSPNTRVIILSMHSNEPYVLEALRNGAWGYVLKTSSATELTLAIHTVAEGQRFLSTSLSKMVIDSYISKSREGSIDPYDTLTRREREVLCLAAEGLNNAEIATHLSISLTTVMTHRNNLMRKLDLHNQTDIVYYALHRGIINNLHIHNN